MLSAICLNNEPCLLTNEVGNEWPYWLLPAKLGASQLASAQDCPKLALRIGHFAT